tara:strand:- start:5047 stop:5250 length:204 start_codon:yes stop_codon:yes gene_type:complete
MNVSDLAIIYPIDPIDLGPVMLRVAISTIAVKKDPWSRLGRQISRKLKTHGQDPKQNERTAQCFSRS